MKVVVLIGTSHRFQCSVSSEMRLAREAFRTYLVRTCADHSAAAIAEEFNASNLAERGADATVAQGVANDHGLRHLFADPTPEERDALGVRDVMSLRLQGPEFRCNWTNEQVEREIQESNGKRERFWLQRLHELNAWPVVFVCGANHVATFAALLVDASIAVDRQADDWEPY